MPPVTYTIRRFQPQDRGRILALWGDRFGEVSQLVRDDLDALVEGDRRLNAYVAAAEDDSIHGFVIGSVETDEDAAETFKHAIPPEAIAGYAGIVTEIAVSRTAEGLGIATELLTEMHNWFAESLAKRVYTVSWRRSDHDSFDLFNSAGYEEVARVDQFYEDRTACPDCGGPCRCAASVLEYESAESPGDRLERTGSITRRATPECGSRRVPDV